ncbi:MAG: serine protease [Pseudomonadota bacterium]
MIDIINILCYLSKMFDKNAILQATQIINVTDSSGQYSWGNGVFISSQHVITASHVVSHAHEMWVGHLNLGTSWELVANDENLDVSIISLPSPLSNAFCSLAYGMPQKRKWVFDAVKRSPNTRTFLASRAREKPAVEDTHLPVMTSVSYVGNGFTEDFFLSLPPFKGLSGSPILNEKGEIISLATHFCEMDDNHLTPGGKVGSKEMPYRFLGPCPWRFTPWMNRQRETLGF